MTTASDLIEHYLADLRGHQPLLDRLDEHNDTTEPANAIRTAHRTDDPFANPLDEDDFDVVVAFRPITDVSTPRNTGKTNTFRLRVYVAGRLAWRQSTDQADPRGADYHLQRVLEAADDRLEIAAGVSAAVPGGRDGTSEELDDEDGTLTLVQDYTMQTTQIHREH